MLVVIDYASMLNVSFSPLGVRFFVSGVSQGREHVQRQREQASEWQGMESAGEVQGRDWLADGALLPARVTRVPEANHARYWP